MTAQKVALFCSAKCFGKLILDTYALTNHYGFTEVELDFIINYDIKYRMGRNGGEED